jgi:hypothetical protein
MTAATLNRPFALSRFALLLRNRLIDDAPAFGVGLALIAAADALSLLVARRPLYAGAALTASAWSAFIFLSALLFAGRAFERMHDGRAATDWLLLPATSLEKYASALAAYALVYPVVAGLAALALSAGFAGLSAGLGVAGQAVWNPFDPELGGVWLGYLLFVLFALAGSARFRKLALVKTGAIVAAASLAVVAAVTAVLWLVDRSLLSGDVRLTVTDTAAWAALRSDRVELSDARIAVLEWLTRAAVAATYLFLLAFGYFRVAEKEAVDEVQ